MLRTAFRSCLKPNVTTRFYHPSSRLLYQPFVEPYTWRTRLWYRRDGTPRSKRKGAFFSELSKCLGFFLLTNT